VILNCERISISLVVFLLFMGGCASSPGTLVARQEPDAFPKSMTAPKDGAYGLFVAGESDAQFTYRLRAGDKLGFEVATAGTVGTLRIKYLYAVYGDQRFRLDTSKTYEWRWLYAKGP
jgi:hypothetical protein